MLLQGAIHQFMMHMCSCHEICISINDIDCLDDGSIAALVITLRGKHAMRLQDQTYSALQNGSSATIDYLGTSYSLVCINNTLCAEVPTVSATMVETSKKYTAGIALGVSAVLIILVFSIIVTIIAWYFKHHKRGRLNLTTDVCTPKSHCQSDICTDFTKVTFCEKDENWNSTTTTQERMGNKQVPHPQIVLSIQFPDSFTSCNCHPAKNWDKSQSQPVFVAFNTRQAPYSSYDRAYEDAANVMPQVQNNSAVLPHFFSNNSTDV